MPKTSSQKSENQNVALYTKYRPKSFDDVVGQEHVTDLLKESLKNNQISHGYLFAGSRGTGKTSIARILAASIGTSQNDLYEIDAASNTSVEDIRALNDAVTSMPFDSKYKVYILDEVHMLSKSAFNALLKTLEEPPKHVIFILATTEPEKIPDTVVSRLETYFFKKPNREVLAKIIKKTAKAEGFEIENSSAELMALLSEGSFRDSHTVLQKVLRSHQGTANGGKISHEEVEKATGAPKSELVNEFLTALATKDADLGLSAIHRVVESNFDIKVFTFMLLEKARALLFMKIGTKTLDEILSITKEEKDFLEKLSKNPKFVFGSAEVVRIINAYSQIGQSPITSLPLEILVSE